MRQSFLKVAALTAGAVLMLAAQAHAVNLTISDAQGPAGSLVSVTVTLASEGSVVAGTENLIAFPTGARIAALANGTPDCEVNEAIMKSLSDAFQPADCEETPEDPPCTGYKGIIISLENTDEIPDGSLLYTCQVQIAEDATGTLPLVCSEPGASDPDGEPLTTTCTDGEITVGGDVATPTETVGGPTDTPSGETPTPTPTSAVAAAVSLLVGEGSGEQGGEVAIEVALQINTLGTEVAGTENVITFTGGIGGAIRGKKRANGSPDCTVNEAIMKNVSAAFQPPMCETETNEAPCTAIKALILSLDNVEPIETGQVLYSCIFEIDELAEDGDYELTCSGANASTPAGVGLSTDCTNGVIHVGPPVGPTFTATPPVVEPTNTPPGGVTPTIIVVVDDGCAITSPATASQNGWLLFLPAAMLVWLRRRSR